MDTSYELKELLGNTVKSKGLRATARSMDVPVSTLRSLLDGRNISIRSAEKIAMALQCKLSLWNLNEIPAHSEITPTLESLQGFEAAAQMLVRAVYEAGGNPIPENLRTELLKSVDDDQIKEPVVDYDTFRHVEIVEIAAAAGSGAEVYDETITDRLAFRRDWLQTHGIDVAMSNVINVKGESMYPTLPDGCSILVDRSRHRRQVGRIYVLRTNDGLVVKRLDKNNKGRWRLISDNPTWSPVLWDQETQVIGEVMWVAMRPK